MDKKKFGTWLKEQRLKKNLTQDELAKAIGLNFSQEIAAFESGSVNFPPKLTSQLCKVLKVDKEKVIQMMVKIKEQDIRKKVAEG